mmetsp:Transcript_28525/g.62764  ORF Transcript_28525/g.62764 Transcript_28525/m.62764 type:complete len:248 (-) Transcript_28525:831-1574(-)
MYLRYSSRVVAPMQRSSPRAKAGLRRLDASMDPEAAPAPTTVCISSINRMISPSDLVTSSSTDLRRSSNSPRMVAPATSAPRSRPTSLHGGFMLSGTSPSIIRCAMPSAMAVFPTPGSPISTGLFLVLLDKIWIALLISSSLPMTGSNFPSLALAVKSIPYFSNESYMFSALLEFAGPVPSRSCCTAQRTSPYLTPCLLNASRVNSVSSCTNARSKASTLTYESFRSFLVSPPAFFNTMPKFRPIVI